MSAVLERLRILLRNFFLRRNTRVDQGKSMTVVSFELPDELVKQLQGTGADRAAEAREALVVKLFREHKLDHQQLSQLLGLDRFATDRKSVV